MTTAELSTRVRSAVTAVAVLTGQTDDAAERELSMLSGVIVDQSAQDRIAAAYDALPRIPDDAREFQSTVAAYAAFVAEVRSQWATLEALGFSLTVQDTDPYSGPAELFADVEQRRIRVLSTKSTGGHPYMLDADNDLFRAVHDILGHAATGRGFDRHGEEAAFQAHSRLFSRTARLALATETRGQNASLHANGEFPEQKIGILPEWAREHDALAFPFALRATDEDRAAHQAARNDALSYAIREGLAR